MDSNTGQLMQALLIASSAIAGFGSIVLVELAKMLSGAVKYVRIQMGIFFIFWALGFFCCVVNSVIWFQNSHEVEVSLALVGWWVQLGAFFLLLWVYLREKFFSE